LGKNQFGLTASNIPAFMHLLLPSKIHNSQFLATIKRIIQQQSIKKFYWFSLG